MPAEILSLGHSTLAYDAFIGLLGGDGVTAVADVRSVPFSRRSPHFSAPAFRASLAGDGIAYVSMGDSLGGRPSAPAGFTDGMADYEAMARVPAYRQGILRLLAGSERHRIAMVCSEGAPDECHRCLLVGRSLAEAGCGVTHILGNGGKVTQQGIEQVLLAKAGGPDLFGPAPTLAAAYRLKASKIAYREPA